MANISSLTQARQNDLSPENTDTNRAKLSSSEIFEKIRPLICSIHSARGESSGFFIHHQGTVLTVAHNIPIGSNNKFTTDLLQVNYGNSERPYFSQPSERMVSRQAEVLDLYSMETGNQIPLSKLDMIPMLPPEIALKEGMKVYFAGYPLGQNVVTFHKGTISSILEDQGIKRFTIDGTVVPGNSGGPVVIQYLGSIYLVGVITSEVADFSPEDQKTISIMKALADARKSQPQSQNPNSMTIDSNGLTVPIQIHTAQGSETVFVNDRDTVCLALDLIQRNLSTGIGQAIDIRQYQALFHEETELKEQSPYSFPVAKGKSLITAIVGPTDENGRITQEFAKYSEVRYGAQGGGNRGIRIVLNQILGRGNLSYKFSPNPHTASGNYNKNQKELYNEAAKEIVKYIATNQSIPQSLEFQACETTYTATREV